MTRWFFYAISLIVTFFCRRVGTCGRIRSRRQQDGRLAPAVAGRGTDGVRLGHLRPDLWMMHLAVDCGSMASVAELLGSSDG